MDNLHYYRSRERNQHRRRYLVSLAGEGVEVVTQINVDGVAESQINGGFLDGESFVGEDVYTLHVCTLDLARGSCDLIMTA